VGCRDHTKPWQVPPRSARPAGVMAAAAR
jgi:hypothetical protein